MLLKGAQSRLALILSVALHALVFAFAATYAHKVADRPTPKVEEQIVMMQLVPQAEKQMTEPAKPQVAPKQIKASKPLKSNPAAISSPAVQATQDKLLTAPVSEQQPASMAAPPAPSAEEWAFAAKYTNKNSKGYRYNWGQQVRSMMGTAVEGADQGVVRFRLEIAPDGTLTKLETLWTTSAVAEKLARKAIQNMPPLPPTPTGKPLIFDKTISFTPYASGGPPMYKNDCLPDPPAFQNPYAWDGKSPQVALEAQRIEPLDPQALADCLKQLPQDSVEAEEANAKGKMDRWGWSSSDLGKPRK